MWNQIKDRRFFQTSKNSTTVIQKSNLNKNLNKIKDRKCSNEKYKTQVINQIYNKLFFSSANNISVNNDKNKSNYNNFINPNKRNIKKNLIRNSQNNKSINQKSSIPLPSNLKSKEKLKIKTKLYSSYLSNDLSKNYLKQTNSTTENMSINDNNNEEKHNKEKKKEKNLINNNNSNENLILINMPNISKNKEEKNDVKTKNINNANNNSTKNNANNNNSADNNNYRRLSNNNSIFQKMNNNQNNKVIDIIEANINYKKKKLNTYNGYKNNKIKEKNSNSNKKPTFKGKNENNKKNKENNKDNKQNNKELESKEKKIKVPKKVRNNIFDTLKENKGNYYFLVVSGNKIDTIKNYKDKNKFRNIGHNIRINNNRTYYLEKISKYIDKIDLSPIPNLIEDSNLKIKDPYNQILVFNNGETVFNEEKFQLINNNKTKILNEEQSISERKNNKYKNFMLNNNTDKNKTIYKNNKILNNFNNYCKFKEEQSSKPYSQSIQKKYENFDKEKSIQPKKANKLKRQFNTNKININDKENKNNNIEINNNINLNNIKNTNIDSKIKNSNSNEALLNNINMNEKFNNKKKIINISRNSKIEISIKKEKKSKKNIDKNNIKSNSNINSINKNSEKSTNNSKNDLNKRYFEIFKDNNNISIFVSDEDEEDKTDKEEKDGEKSPHINKLVTYFNDAKKNLKKSNYFNKSSNPRNFMDIISPNKSSIIQNYNKIEDDELSNRTIKVPIFVDVNLLNNLIENNINKKNINLKINNLYDIISKFNTFKPKNYLLNFIDDKSLMILSSVNRQFYINLRILFYSNIYKKIFSNEKINFINKIKLSLFKYASNEIKTCNKIKLKEIYESYGNKTSIYDDLIIKDINRTFPYDLNFKQNSAKYKKLYRILTRYSNYNKLIGYAQGLNFIVANAITYFDNEEEVFLFMDGLINLFKVENYMGENNINLTSHIKKYSNIISKHIPDVIKYLEKKLLTPDFFSVGWILTLFSNAMNNKNLLITWCFMIVFGWKFFYCFVIQILLFYKSDIYKSNENNLSKKMKRLLREERFNNDIKKIINKTLYFMSQNIIL